MYGRPEPRRKLPQRDVVGDGSTGPAVGLGDCQQGFDEDPQGQGRGLPVGGVGAAREKILPALESTSGSAWASLPGMSPI